MKDLIGRRIRIEFETASGAVLNWSTPALVKGVKEENGSILLDLLFYPGHFGARCGVKGYLINIVQIVESRSNPLEIHAIVCRVNLDTHEITQELWPIKEYHLDP